MMIYYQQEICYKSISMCLGHVQAGAFIMRYNITSYCIQNCRDIIYIALTGELWGAYCETFGKNVPRYNGTALYYLEDGVLHADALTGAPCIRHSGCLSKFRVHLAIPVRTREACSFCICQLYIRLQRTLQWRHNKTDGVSNHRRFDYLLNRLFRHRSKQTWKLCVTGLNAGNQPVTDGFPS